MGSAMEQDRTNRVASAGPAPSPAPGWTDAELYAREAIERDAMDVRLLGLEWLLIVLGVALACAGVGMLVLYGGLSAILWLDA